MGKNVLSVLATIMIAIGVMFLAVLAGDVARVVLILLSGLGMGVFGFFGKESTFRTAVLACGEVLVLIALMMAGAYYNFFSAGLLLLLSLFFAAVCFVITLKKTHPILNFTANAGLFTVSIYFASSGLEMTALALAILSAMSFGLSILSKKNMCAANLFMTNVIILMTVSALVSEPIVLIALSLIQVVEFSYFKMFDVKPILGIAHVGLWTVCNFIAITNYCWDAYRNTEYIFKSEDAVLYAGVSLALACVAVKITSMIRSKDHKLLDLGLLLSLFVPIFCRFFWEGGLYWHLTNTNVNYFALVLFGIPGLCLVLGLAKERNKLYTVIGTVLLSILTAVIPHSEHGGGLFDKGLWIGESGAAVWAIISIIGFCLLNFYLKYKGEDNKVATLISVIGTYLSVYMLGNPIFAIFTAIITLIVSAAQYYFLGFKIGLYITSHIFDIFVLSAITSGASTDVLSVLLFAIAQASMFFTVKRAIDTGKVYIWITSLFRMNVFIVALGGALGANFIGFVVSGILVVISAILIYIGFKFNIKSVRVFGLWELIAVVVKMCLLDITGANPIIRIVAFIGSGLICLAISALYGKYEKISSPESHS